MSSAFLEIQNLYKTFHSEDQSIEVLRGINLSIEKGDIFGIVGFSGAGKSTLIRCLNRLEEPDSGSIRLGEIEITTLPKKELNLRRQKIGMIFQQFNLLMQRTSEGNICFPLELAGTTKSEAKKRATELLELVGLSDKAKAYPSQLSGGQKQRIAIARALATSPKVLLCDEATSALDPTTTASILSLLKDINQRLGITIIIITHEMSVIERICNRVAIIDESKIAEVGAVKDIFSKPQTAAAQKLVYPEGKRIEKFSSKRCMRIVFDGNSSFEPVVANMVLECKAPVNIMYADTKNIDGKAFGQMVVQLPEDEALAQKMFTYVRARGLSAEEVSGYVG